MGIFLTFSIFELQRGYLYQNGVEIRQKMIGAVLNLFWGHLFYVSGGIWTFPLLSATYASAPIAERAIIRCFYLFILLNYFELIFHIIESIYYIYNLSRALVSVNLSGRCFHKLSFALVKSIFFSFFVPNFFLYRIFFNHRHSWGLV